MNQHRKIRASSSTLSLLLACWLSHACFADETRDADAALAKPDSTVGIVDDRPEQGISIRVDDRYMVPYRSKIPGTDVSFEMVPVAGGVFQMGSPATEAGRAADEGPQIMVRVAPMWVGKFEVTQAEYHEFELLYRVFVEIHADSPAEELKLGRVDTVTAPTELYDPDMVYAIGEGPTYPAVSMTQYAAQQYTKWLSAITKCQYRLPTEAEWEYACRAGSTGSYGWGDAQADIGSFAWYSGNSRDGLSPVGQKLANAFGIFDMHGNAAEWTVNAHTRDGYQWLFGKGIVSATEAVRWPETSTACVVRGGTWDSDWPEIRSAARLASDDDLWKDEDAMFPNSPWWFTTDPGRSVGFRLFRSYEPLAKDEIRNFWDHTSPEVIEYVEEFLNNGRGKIGILDENLVPATRKYRIQEETRQNERMRRRQLQLEIRGARPGLE